MGVEVYVASDDDELLGKLKEKYPEQSFLTNDSDAEAEPSKVVSASHEVVEESDGVLVVYDGSEDYIADVLVRTAYEHGTPVVVYNDTDETVEPWLAYHTRYVDDRISQAVPCLLMYAGVSAEQVVSKG